MGQVQGQRAEGGGRMSDGYSELSAEIRGYLIGATVLKVSVCDRLASDIAGMALKNRERTEFGEIVARLKQRGVLARDFDAGTLEVPHG
jgi:hypothetical protein